MEIAKVFWSGRSQAVRLPKQFRSRTIRECARVADLRVESWES